MTPTPSPAINRGVNTGGTVNFVIDNGDFVCNDVKELKDCDTGLIYYVAGNLQITGTTIVTGTTFQAYLNGSLKCLTYQRDVNGSATAYLGEVVQKYVGGCASCGITPTPSTTPTNTPTVTPTLTPTPTSSAALNTQYVFSSCTQNKVILQTVPPGSLSSGLVVQISGSCYTYMGSYTNYIVSSGVQSINVNAVTSTPSTIYDNCITCSIPPAYVYQVVRQTANCQNQGSTITVSKPSNITAPTVGQYVSLSGSGYAPYCWKVVGIVTNQPTSTSIIGVHNSCDCAD